MTRLPLKLHMQRLERGAILVWVVMTLTVIGALAYAMTRQSGMAAIAVGAGADTARARYLAEAGLNHARWQNEKAGCNGHANVMLTSLPGLGSYRAVVTASGKNGTAIDIQAISTTLTGGSYTLSKTGVIMHDTQNAQQAQFGPAKGASDIWLSADFPTQTMSNATYLELSQNRSNALLQFALSGIPVNSRVNNAALNLSEFLAGSGGVGQVSAHAVLTSWDAKKATWQDASKKQVWTTPGGDYDSANLAALTTAGAGLYSWDVTQAVDGWINNVIANNGLLLKPDGPLSGARFVSLEDPTSPATPQLLVDYSPPCP